MILVECYLQRGGSCMFEYIKMKRTHAMAPALFMNLRLTATAMSATSARCLFIKPECTIGKSQIKRLKN